MVKKKLSFNRATSEPPSGNKNAVMPEDNIIALNQKKISEMTSNNINNQPSEEEKSIPPLL